MGSESFNRMLCALLLPAVLLQPCSLHALQPDAPGRRETWTPGPACEAGASSLRRFRATCCSTEIRGSHSS